MDFKNKFPLKHFSRLRLDSQKNELTQKALRDICKNDNDRMGFQHPLIDRNKCTVMDVQLKNISEKMEFEIEEHANNDPLYSF